MDEVIFKTEKLTKKYHDFSAVDDANMKIKKGEIYGLVGKNGAGKTTLLKMICGLALPTSGQIELFGEASQSGLNKARMRTGSMIEDPCFFPYLSAARNLEYYRIQRGIPEKNTADEALKIVGLTDTGNKKFKNFSLGMKQRLGLALAIMANPDLLILDEPINGLDPMGIVEFRDIVLKLNKEKNVTVIISSHILSELSQLATTYGFIDKGRFIEQISSKELEEKCRTCLSITAKNPEKAAAVIEKELNCKKFEVLSNNEIRLYEYIDTPEMVVKALTGSGVILCTISRVGTNLENYFINLIGGNSND